MITTGINDEVQEIALADGNICKLEALSASKKH